VPVIINEFMTDPIVQPAPPSEGDSAEAPRTPSPHDISSMIRRERERRARVRAH
jgi:hypothetical protein